jgi:hypothetical protein
MAGVTAGGVAAGDRSAALLLADPDMAFLRDALVASRMEGALRPLLRDWSAEPLDVQVRGVRVVRHKAGRRCLIDYDVWVQRAGGVPEAMPLLGKVSARALDERSYRTQKHLWRNGFDSGSSDGISVAEPVGKLPELRMWLQRRVGGQPAWPSAAGTAQRALVRRIADAVHKLHRTQARPNRAHGVTDELSILRERLGALARLRPSLASRIDRVLTGCARVAETLLPRATCGIHRDFYPDQLLVDDDRVYLLDLDLYCAGDPALDYGNYIGHLMEHSLRLTGRPDAYAEAQAELEDRFAAAWSARDGRTAVRGYATLTLVRHIDISTRIADRQPFTELILESCETRLEAASATPSRK